MKTLKYSILISAVFCLVLGFGHGVWASPLLPDLAVDNVRVVKRAGTAFLEITLANTGNVSLPPIAYGPGGVGIEVVVNNHHHNQSAGRIKLNLVDRRRILLQPHRKISFFWKSDPQNNRDYTLPPGSSGEVTVTVDYNNVLRESNEGNNSLTRPWCNEGANYGPIDLVVTKIERTKNFRIKITIAIKGTVRLPKRRLIKNMPMVTRLMIEMRNNGRNWGVMNLGNGPRGSIFNSSGTKSFLWNSNNHSTLLAGKNDIVVTIDSSHDIQETNETNNSLDKVLYGVKLKKTPRVPKSVGKVKPAQEPHKVPRVPTPREKVEGSMKRLPVNNFKNIPNKGTGVK